MKKLCAGVALALAVSAPGVALAATPAPTPTPSASDRTDPRLAGEIRRAEREGAHTEGRRIVSPRVLAEVVTTDTEAVIRRSRAIGAEVTGSVPGALVQVLVPTAAIDALASLPSVTELRSPAHSGRVPRTDALPPVDTGTQPSELALTNMSAWRSVQRGAGVKVGIVDYFDTFDWNTLEHGPLPDAGHQFCRDSFNSGLCNGSQIAQGNAFSDPDTFHHGLAVAEIIHDMAPDATLYLATVGTTADLQAAINWFGANGVTVINRSLGSAYDGPGDGTGPLAAVVDSAVRQGITWFNSAGNDGSDAYLRRVLNRTVPVDGGNFVNFNDGRRNIAPATDTWLRIDSGPDYGNASGCFFMDGVRWANDWRLPKEQRTDYSVEFWQPRSTFAPGSEHRNPTPTQVEPINLNAPPFGPQGAVGGGQNIVNRNQRGGLAPLEAADIAVCPTRPDPFTGDYVTYLRIRRNAATPVGATADRVEVALAGGGLIESGLSDRAGSAAKPVVDSKNPGLVAVGAVEVNPGLRLAGTDGIAYYSSQGPTSDGRVKPDVSAPSGFDSVSFGGQFSGTSSASPTAAGVAAVLKGAGLAATPAALAAQVQRFVKDKGTKGWDNAYGAGAVLLPAPPSTPAAVADGRYVPITPVRALDTRPASAVGPATLIGAQRPNSIVDLRVAGIGTVPEIDVSAVAVVITSLGNPAVGAIQAIPYLRGAAGGTNTMSVNRTGWNTPGFAIVPLGHDGRISLYNTAGGNVAIDIVGYFTTGETMTADGRMQVPSAPEVGAATTVAGAADVITGIDPAVEALMVSVTVTPNGGSGFVRLHAADTAASTVKFSNLRYSGTTPVTTTAIVPTGSTHAVTATVSKDSAGPDVRVRVTVLGRFTSIAATPANTGFYRPATPTRVFNDLFSAGQTRPNIAVAGGATGLAPSGDIIALTGTMSVLGQNAAGCALTAYPAAAPSPVPVFVSCGPTGTSSVSTLIATAGTGTATTNVGFTHAGRVIIDANGYFLVAPSP